MSIKSCRFYIIFVDSSLQLVPNARDDHDDLDEARRILEAELNAETERQARLNAEREAQINARRILEAERKAETERQARLNAEAEARRIIESRNEVFSVLFLVAIIFMIYILFATAYSWAIKFF